MDLRAIRSAGFALLLGAVVTSACGSARTDEELRAAYNRTPPAAAPPAPANAAWAPASADERAVTSAASPDTTPTVAPHLASGRLAGSGAPAPRAVRTPTGVAGSPASTPTSLPFGPTGGRQPSVAAPAGPVGAQEPAGRLLPPIVMGSIGSDSGVLGVILLPVLQGAKAWVADVNARGGVAGHPVKVIFADDGGEPARALALAKRLVDQDGAVAFFAERGPGTAQAVNTFLEQRSIPVIGGCGCSVSAAKSPMSFMVGAGGDYGLAWMQTLPLLVYSDKRKVSVLYCRESPSCKSGRDHVVDEFAKEVGLEVVHEAQVTITAPDYTAEVLAARNAGAEAFIAFMDTFSETRLARAAHRQNWYPVFAINYSGHDERFTAQGGDDVEGFVVGAAMPHWSSPKLDDYRIAMQKYVPGGVLASIGEMAWAAGKLIETIGRQFPDKPTSSDFLRGLYALDGETLGGLVPPLTYRPGQGSDQSNYCIVPMRIVKGKHVPRNGDEFTCAPGWQPVRKELRTP